MAKTTKKKNRRLKRQIRKTVGALLMVSAITVAAIPVQDVSANPSDTETPKVAVTGFYTTVAPQIDNYKSTIPNVWDVGNGKNTIIYNSGDSTYQFAYVPAVKGDTTKIAVILRYSGGDLENSSLEIPATLLAYRPLADNASNNTYNCLVSKNDEFLYYETMVHATDNAGVRLYRVTDVMDPDNNNERLLVNENQLQSSQNPSTPDLMIYVTEEDDVDAEGNTIKKRVEHKVEKETTPYYNPCYYNKIDEWKDLEDEQLYYETIENGKTVYKHPNGNDEYYKIVADVAYIGAEKITEEIGADGKGTGKWILAGTADNDSDRFIDEPGDGVFANKANITNLTIGEKIRGIGDYAFQGCSTLSSVKLANGLETIGNGAFANCIRLTQCEIASNANITAIGKDAFYNCVSLASFQVPINVRAIGDSCFDGCTALTSVEMQGGDGGAVMLSVLGNHVFRGCSALGSLTFPRNYSEQLGIGIVEGCTGLQYIRVNNRDFNFVENKDDPTDGNKVTYSFNQFKETVPPSFYIIGPVSKAEEDRNKTAIHQTANDQAIAFKYPDQELYEVVKEEAAVGGTTPDPAKLTYQVNDKNELVSVRVNGTPENITLPEKIGPYGISAIGKGSFNDNCTLKKITIPASVTSIGDEAFKGCHELKTVIFTDASTMQSIGTDAFKTQTVTCQHSLSANPELTFVGAMINEEGKDTVPFMYAMNGVSNINNNNQEKSWITCHSGWPTNIEVQYKYDPISNTGRSELIGYPKYEMIKTPDSAKIWVKNLPYVTGAPDDPLNYVPPTPNPDGSSASVGNYDEYLSMVLKATEYYQDPTKPQPTENEMAIVNSALNVVIPSSVDSIKPGLFSGYQAEVDQSGNKTGNWEKVDNFKDYATDTETHKPDMDIQTVTIYGVKEIEPYTFKNCTSLREAALFGPSYIDDYAFDGAKDDKIENSDPDIDDSPYPEMSLQKVTLGTNLTDTGKRPFRGCGKLTQIDCLDEDFRYRDGILYRNTANGREIVECLEGRGDTRNGVGNGMVGPEELAEENVTSIKAEAFENCNNIGWVDLSQTKVKDIPENCFKDTSKISTVSLPNTIENILEQSFLNSGIAKLTIPTGKGLPVYMAKDAFGETDETGKLKDPKDTREIYFECIEGYNADIYAGNYIYIKPVYGKVFVKYDVTFWDYPDYPDTSNPKVFWTTEAKEGEVAPTPPTNPEDHNGYTFSGWMNNRVGETNIWPLFGNQTYKVEFRDNDGTLLDTQYVEGGKNAVPPVVPPKENASFTGEWKPDYRGITADTVCVAQYDYGADAQFHTATFYSYDGSTVVAKLTVFNEGTVYPPSAPEREGYKFVGWVPAEFTNITKDMTYTASYDRDSSGGNNGGSGSGSGNGSGSGSGSKSSPSPSSSTSPSPSATPGVKKYTVSVSGGSGSGEYAAGEIVAVNAYYMGEGQAFDKWTSSTAGVGFSNPNATSATFTMPAANVAVTATYKTGSGTTNVQTSTNNSGGGGGTGAVNTVNNNGTTVDVTRPGISNTNLAGATVSGATDNFIVKVTEDQAATNAVTVALQARYGDLSRIKYLPMDISLYDSTGRTKIADTSGISVNLTLPLPDDLVQYAGNNRVAAVSGGVLEDLNARFTTVGGVPCVNFTATHFSPYVIYVDTANLSEAVIDATPKTGDPIHPKWFLAIGLACISLVLFFKRDKKVVINAKAA